MSEQQFSADEIRVLKALAAGLLAAQMPSGGNGACAGDADLDGKYGDPRVRKDPSAKYWTGESHVGMPLSACSPEYLDAFAKWKDACAYMNRKDGSEEKLKYAGYEEKDAARARGWAVRIRAGWKAAATETPKADEAAQTEEDNVDDIPF
jgi:hypothetical protein